jgi:hypothetical protein
MGKLSDLFVNVGAKTDDFKKGMHDVKSEGEGLGHQFKEIGEKIIAAFAIERLAEFAMECSEIGGAAETVGIAFKRLNDPNLLKELQSATKGTADDLTLMKTAVQSNALGIPLKQLGTLLEFAHQRAEDMGGSVDDFIQRVIYGIGRKSTRTLTELGVAAIDVKNKFKDIDPAVMSTTEITKAYVEIAEEGLKKVGAEGIEPNIEKIERLKTSWKNTKIEIGQAVNTLIVKFLDLGNAINKAFSNEKGIDSPVIQERANARFKDYVDEVERAKKASKDTNEFWAALNRAADKLFFKIKDLEEKKGRMSIADLVSLSAYRKQYDYTKKITDELAAAEDKKFAPESEIKQTSGYIQQLEKQLEKLKERKNLLPAGAHKELLEIGQDIKNVEDHLKALNDLSEGKTTKGELIKARPGKVTGGQVATIDTSKIQPQLAQTQSAYQDFSDNIVDITDQLNSSLQGFAENLANNIGAAFSGTMTLGDAFISAMADFMSTLGQQMIAVGVAGIALKFAGVNPFAALAAGVALVALAGVARATMSSGVGGGSSSSGVSSGASSNVGNNEMTVYIEGVTKGSDIYWSQKNYNNKLDSTISR